MSDVVSFLLLTASQPHLCPPTAAWKGRAGLAGARRQPLHEKTFLCTEMLVASLSCLGNSPVDELYKTCAGWMRAGRFPAERGGRVSFSGRWSREARPLVSAAPPPSAGSPALPACEPCASGSPAGLLQRAFDRRRFILFGGKQITSASPALHC